MHKSTQARESKINYKLGYNTWLENNRVDIISENSWWKEYVYIIIVLVSDLSSGGGGGGGGGGAAMHARSGSPPNDKSSY